MRSRSRNGLVLLAVLCAVWVLAAQAPRPPTGVTITAPNPFAPGLTVLNPSSGLIGATVTITGTNMGASQGVATVTFNGIPATATAWSATSLTVTVPVGTTTGSVLVTRGALVSNALTFTISTGGSDLIAANRVIAWAPGVPGGIPARLTVCYTDTGGIDSIATINTQIAACAVGQTVQLQAGTYTINTQILIAKGVTLRGASATTTLLDCAVAWHCLQMGNFPAAAVSTNVSGSPAKGATTLTVASITTPALAVNDYIVIDQLNDGVEVVNIGSDGTDGDARGGTTRSMAEIKKITAINGLILTIDPPLYHAYVAAQDPEVWELGQTNGRTLQAGVENLTVTRTSPTDTGNGFNNVHLVACVECWVKNIVSVDANVRHVELNRSYRWEVRDSYFDDGLNHGTGGFAYGVTVDRGSADGLAENNIFRHLRHAMVIKGSASGNVFGYNYSRESYGGDTFLYTDANAHGAHAMFNLFEGNIVGKVKGDDTHGSSSYNTVFRTHATRASAPAETTITQGLWAVNLETHNRYWNIVGSILGSSGQSFTALEAGSTRTNANAYVYTFGYPFDSNTPQVDPTIGTDTYRHGNFDYQSNSVIWDASNSNHTLPSSLYLSAKPSFFGVCAWPAIGSDLTPMVKTLPAKDRYDGTGLCAPSVLVITTTSLPSATEDVAYSNTVVATGGTLPYVFGNNGAGTTLNDSDAQCAGLTMATSGAITGAPTTSGICSFTASVTDAAAVSDTQALSITISAPGSFFFTGTLRTPASCSSANVQTAITAAVTGDIVRLPAPCTATWAINSVNIPSTKGIYLDGDGAVITRSGADQNTVLTVNVGTSSTRVTDFTFTGGSAPNQGWYVTINTSLSSAPFRLDTIVFNGPNVGIHIKVNGPGYGLIDHVALTGSVGGTEFIHALGYSNGDTTGWAQVVTPGSADALYVEDSTFTNTNSPNAVGVKTLATYGSRTVYRFNTLTRTALDVHGNVHPTGRWWEYYKNTFLSGGGSNNVSDWMIFRGGSGFAWGNVATGANAGGGQINSYEDSDDGNTGAWPQAFQVGMGGSTGAGTTPTPAYMFLNTGSDGFSYSFPTDEDTVVQRGRDVLIDLDGDVTVSSAALPATCSQFDLFWKTNEGEWWAANPGTDGRAYRCDTTNNWTLHYTPYTYPHPLQSSLEPDK